MGSARESEVHSAMARRLRREIMMDAMVNPKDALASSNGLCASNAS
jgi:hypothetical protein